MATKTYTHCHDKYNANSKDIFTYVHIYKYACVHVCSDSGYICIYMCVCIYLSVSLWVQRDARKVFLLSVYTYVIGKCVPSLLLTGRCHTQTSLARARAPLRSRQLQNVSRFSRNYFVLFFFFFLPFFFLLLHRSALFDSFGKINQSVVSLLSLRVLGWFFVARALSRIASRRDEDSFDDERLQEKRAIAKKNPVKLSVWLSVWCSDVKKRKKKKTVDAIPFTDRSYLTTRSVPQEGTHFYKGVLSDDKQRDVSRVTRSPGNRINFPRNRRAFFDDLSFVSIPRRFREFPLDWQCEPAICQWTNEKWARMGEWGRERKSEWVRERGRESAREDWTFIRFCMRNGIIF